MKSAKKRWDGPIFWEDARPMLQDIHGLERPQALERLWGFGL